MSALRLVLRTILSYDRGVTGSELLRRLKRLARRGGLDFREAMERGKGSHRTVYLGDRFAVLKDPRKEIGRGLLRAMCRQLGIDERDLY